MKYAIRRSALPRKLVAAICATVALAVLAPQVSAMEIEGVRFDDAARLGGKALQLNGTGLRSVFVIKGYVAALYLPERARNATVALGTRGPKRLQIRLLREVESDTFVKALNEGLRENHSELQMRMLGDRVTQLESAMNEVGTARRGDIINFDFTPDGGTVVAMNGIPRGRPIPGEDFYQAVLRIFLGEHPVDRALKRGLLGG
ncbi:MULTISPECIES: chalcone isomerase family protein [unclassified Cupriavidus]|uniref:chalcone isomerase family protein n=1 Tax=unclassified Cupriavidus TaxID=2640874 RepID=UPI00087E7AE3|nr:chalcone isomerase family protein [Cupriavidus sp. YR651]SDC48054.1 Chalcone isomerase-like [Cupriavidus sp. YR651]